MNFLNLGRYVAIILMVQFPLASFSQEQSKTANKAGQQEQIASSRLNTVQLLDYARRLSDDARGLKPLDEIPLQTRLADTVWPLDRSLAERFLVRSFELTVALLKESSEPTSASSTADPQTIFAQISSIASRHDATLEKSLKDKWQQATASVGENGNIKSKPDPTQLSYLLLSQSANYLKTDEQKARQVFRQSVSLRVTQDHYFFLLNNRQRASEITDTLFSDTLDVLAQRPLSDANELLMLSSYVFSPNGSVTYAAISGYNTANVTANMSAVPKNAALAKRYLALLLAKVNANELVPSAVAYFTLKNLLPQYQVLAPELLNDVYAKTASLLSTVSKDDSATFDDAHKSSNASESEKTSDWEKRIEKADKLEPEDWRDFEYFTIIFGYLLPKKDFAKAATLVSRVSNQDLKEKFGDVVNLAALQDKLEKVETAFSVSESDCNKIKTPLVRVVALSSVARARVKQKAAGDAVRLFERASGEATQIKDDQDRIQAKLMLVQLSLDVDSPVAFEWAAGAFKEINKFSDFNMNRSSFSLSAPIYGLQNQLSIDSPAPSSLLSAVAKMCHVNCAETFQTSRLLERKEIRLWANYFAVRTGLRESSRQVSGEVR
ncbi:MAG TPA: hypothetical protein VJR02_03325 [Pyrinomonadaceae bacterium]|nr:hypothetical protein [Pyrinomonadaceae bacterium]